MIKQLFKLVNALILLTIVSGHSYAQDYFSVKSPSSDNNNNMLWPIKAGVSTSFDVKVTNNLSVYALVSIDTLAMGGEVASWSKVDRRNDTIKAGQTKVFKVTLTVPEGTDTRNYDFDLRLKAVDGNGTNRNYYYERLRLIVDNEVPDAPAFITTSRSTAIEIKSWSSVDNESDYYSGLNNVGVRGIDKFVVYLKNSNDAIIGTPDTISASNNSPKTISGLSSNTSYTAVVKAIDLAGNLNATELATTTAPSAPVNLAFSNTTYASTTLSWKASAGATGYNVYRKTGSTNTKLNSSPIAGTSYTIENLEAATAYQFSVIALGNAGNSDMSAGASVTTQAIPSISGSSTLCSGTQPYTIRGLASGHTVVWSKSSNLKLVSQSGAIAYFMVMGNGSGWIDAEVRTPNGKVYDLAKRTMWIGKPSVPTTYPSGYPTIELPIGAMEKISLSSYKGALSGSGHWWLSGSSVKMLVNKTGSGILVEAVKEGLTNFYVTTSNFCGTSGAGGGLIRVTKDGGGGLPVPLKISPNPGNDVINLDFSPDKQNASRTKKMEEDLYEINVYSGTMELIYHKKTTETKLTLNTSSLKRGFYYVNIRKGEDIVRKQFYISHD